MQLSVCIDPLFAGMAAHEKIYRVAEAGIRAVDMWGWRDKDIPALKEACRQTGVRVVNMNGHRAGSMVAADTHPTLLREVAETLPVARELDCHAFMMITNQLNPDDSAVPFPKIPDHQKRAAVEKVLRDILAITPADHTLMLEPLNTRVDHPGYWLTDIPTAADIVTAIADERLKILCDLYHMGVMGHDLNDIIDRYLPLIGYFHAADFPGRHQPGTGSADWPALLRRIHAGGYTGVVSFEYVPLGDSADSLHTVLDVWEKAGC